MSGEGGGVKGAALGKVFQVVMDLFALFGLARHLSVSGLNSFFLHSQGSVNLNKNQLFFFVLPSHLPKSPQNPCTPRPTPVGPAGHRSPPPNLSISIPKFRSLQEIPSSVEISKDKTTENCWQSHTGAKHTRIIHSS